MTWIVGGKAASRETRLNGFGGSNAGQFETPIAFITPCRCSGAGRCASWVISLQRNLR
jgi:hypothetical protein